MRRFPSSWNETLTALGFRRKRRSQAKGVDRGHRSRFESLERRELLSGTPNEPVYTFVVSDESDAYNPADQFVLSTEYDETTSAPRAVLSLRDDLTDETLDIALQEIAIELRQGGQVLETQAILVDIAEEAFLTQFTADRLAEAELQTSGNQPLEAPTLPGIDLEVLLDAGGFIEGRESGVIDTAAAVSYYDDFALAVLDAAQRELNASTTDDLDAAQDTAYRLATAGLQLVGQISVDRADADPTLASSANALRETLAEHASAYHTALSGFGHTEEVAREWRLAGTQEFVLALVDEPVYHASDRLRIELGDQPAMVQATITAGIGVDPVFATAVWNDLTTRDVTVDSDQSTVNLDGDVLTVSLDAGGTGAADAVFTVGLDNHLGAVPESATVTLEADAVRTAGDNAISAHWDFWGISDPSGTVWDETQLDWDAYQADLASDFRGTLDTQTVSSAGDVVFTVTEAVQRALLAGDVNLDGQYKGDLTDRVGDVEAMYLAVRDWDAYVAMFEATAGATGVVNNSGVDHWRHRTDIDWDGDVDSSDFMLLKKRLNYEGGDFNYDGYSDGYDYSIYQANYGSPATLHQQGDANADGIINVGDYSVWANSEGESHGVPLTPELTFRLTAANGAVDVDFDSQENAGVFGGSTARPAELDSTGLSDVVITSFVQSTTTNGWEIEYEVLNEDWTGGLSLSIAQSNSATAVISSLSLPATTVGKHTESILPSQITLLGAVDTDYELTATIESGVTALSSREFAGGLFADSANAWHFHGSEGRDEVYIDESSIAIGERYYEPFDGGGGEYRTTGPYAQTVHFDGASAPSALYLHLAGGHDQVRHEFTVGNHVWIDGGTGDDIYDFSPEGEDYAANKQLTIVDESGFDQLLLPNLLISATPLDLRSDQVQQFAVGATGHSLDLVLGSAETIQYVANGPSAGVTGLGYDGADLFVDAAGSIDDGLVTPGQLTLREAIRLSELIPGAHTIVFDAELFEAGHVNLPVGSDPRSAADHNQFEINDTLTIRGPGRDLLTLDAQQKGRAFRVNAGAELTLSDFSVTGGYVTTTNSGGAMYSQGSVTIERMRWHDNFAHGSTNSNGGHGGAIYAYNADLHVADSLFDNNDARWGGAVYFRPDFGESLLVERSTFTENEANYRSGGGYGSAVTVYSWSGSAGDARFENSTFSGNYAYRGGTIWVSGNTTASALDVDFVNSTIAHNTVDGPGNGGAGLYDATSGVTTLDNTILVDNVQNAAVSPNDYDLWYRSSNISGSNNLIGRTYKDLATLNDTIEIGGSGYAGLMPLGDYGGTTPTHALAPDSPAIDRGLDSASVNPIGTLLATDQRGGSLIRVVDYDTDFAVHNVDIGAFEATPQITTAADNGLVIYGTPGDDHIVLTDTGVYLGGLDGPFTSISGISSYAYVQIDGLNGDDLLEASPTAILMPSLALVGGAGDDTLSSHPSITDAELRGGEGDDRYLVHDNNETLINTLRITEELDGGDDTIDFSHITVHAGIDFDIADDQQNIGRNSLRITNLDVIEGVVGTSGDDEFDLSRLSGKRVSIAGGNGNDVYTLARGFLAASGYVAIVEDDLGGSDEISFNNASIDGGAFIDLSATQPYSALENNSWLTAGYSELVIALDGSGQVEKATGTFYDDVLVSHGINNTLAGGNGDDTYKIVANDHFGTHLIEDASGTNTLDMSAIDLGTGLQADISLLEDIIIANATSSSTIEFAGGSSIDNVIGTPYGDTIVGNANANVLEGFGGDDWLVGLEGDDTYVFGDTYNLGVDSITETHADGGADTLDFSSLPHVSGASVDIGSTALQQVATSSEGDLHLFLSDSGGIENVSGSLFNDSLRGNARDNVLSGSLGDDTYVYAGSGPFGHDSIEDVLGFDNTLNFTGLQVGSGIAIDLADDINALTPVASMSGSFSINATNAVINSVFGTEYADDIAAGRWGSRLAGGMGDDTYRFAHASHHADTVIEHPGEGTDTLDYSTYLSSSGISIDLGITDGKQTLLKDASSQIGLRLDLSAGWDIENVIGTNADDTFAGNQHNNTFYGGGGQDTYAYSGQGAHGHDTIYDGSGITYDFSGLQYGVGVSPSLIAGADAYEYIVSPDYSLPITAYSDDTNSQIALPDIVVGTAYVDDFSALYGDLLNHTPTIEYSPGFDVLHIDGDDANYFDASGVKDRSALISVDVANASSPPVLEVAPAVTASGDLAVQAGTQSVHLATLLVDGSPSDAGFGGVVGLPGDSWIESDGRILWNAPSASSSIPYTARIRSDNALGDWAELRMTVRVTQDNSIALATASAGGADKASIIVRIGPSDHERLRFVPLSTLYTWSFEPSYEMWRLSAGGDPVSMEGYGDFQQGALELPIGSETDITLGSIGSRTYSLSDFAPDFYPGETPDNFEEFFNLAVYDGEGGFLPGGEEALLAKEAALGSNYDWSASLLDHKTPANAGIYITQDTFEPDGTHAQVVQSYNDATGEYHTESSLSNILSGTTLFSTVISNSDVSSNAKATVKVFVADIDAAGLSDDQEDDGTGKIELNEHGLATITVRPVQPAVPGSYTLTGDLYYDAAGTQPVQSGTSFAGDQLHTLYAKGKGSVTGTFTLDAPAGDDTDIVVDGSASDTVALWQKAIVIGIGGTESEKLRNDHLASGSAMRAGSHVANFVADARARYTEMVEGPEKVRTGSDSDESYLEARAFYEEMIRQHGEDTPIAIVGWSRGAVIALWMANELQNEGIDVDFVGLYDPVDNAKVIPDNALTRMANTGGKVAGVASREGSPNKDYENLMPRLLDLTADQKLKDREISGVFSSLYNASHGALGGMPGYNNDSWAAWVMTTDVGAGYNYQTDVQESIRADTFIRVQANAACIVIPTNPPYPFPEEDPDK